jgi:hypothetical protein
MRLLLFVGGEKAMVWNILALLLTLWLLLSSLHVGLGLIHLLPFVAFVVLVANVLAASRTVA